MKKNNRIMNRNVKNSVYFSIFPALLGGVYGLLLQFILMAVAIPKLHNVIIPKSNFLKLWIAYGLESVLYSPWGTIIGILFALLNWFLIYLFLTKMSEYAGIAPFRLAAKMDKIIMLLSILILPALFLSRQKYLNLLFLKIDITDCFPAVVFGILGMIISGLVWIFSSAKYLGKDRAKQISLDYKWCFLLGLTGCFISSGIITLYGNMRIHYYYFIPYAEEIFLTSKGLVFSVFIFVLSGFILLGMIGSVLYSLAPVKLPLKLRAKRVMPGGILLIASLSAYWGLSIYLNRHYDYGNKSFAEAMGITENRGKTKSVLLLTETKAAGKTAKVKNIRLETVLYFDGSEMNYHKPAVLSLTANNLEKVDEYIKKHKKSFYLNEAYRVLAFGYLLSWDTKRGFQARHISAGSGGNITGRMLELSSLQRMPVTGEYKKYLDELADETKYRHSPGTFISLARVYRRFGNEAKMEYFRNKAIESPSAEHRDLVTANNIVFPKSGPLTKGIIKGRVKTFRDIKMPQKAGLFWAELEKPENLGFEGISVELYLVSGKEIAPDGSFKFENLGEGSYQLAFMFAGEELSENDSIEVFNNPGIIRPDKNKPLWDLGLIRLAK